MGGKRYALHTIQTKRGRHLPDYNPVINLRRLQVRKARLGALGKPIPL